MFICGLGTKLRTIMVKIVIFCQIYVLLAPTDPCRGIVESETG